MKRITLLLVFSHFTLFAVAQKGVSFPEIQGETLTNETITVPTDTKDKVTVVGIAYSRKSEQFLQEWFAPAYRTFIDPPKEVFVPVTQYDVNLFFIPMIKGIEKAAAEAIVKNLTDNIDPKLHQYVLVYKGAIGAYKKTLKLGRKDYPYFFIIGKDGKILYNTSGAYSKEKMNEITDLLDSLE